VLEGAKVAADVEDAERCVAAGEKVLDEAAGEGVALVVVEREVEERVVRGGRGGGLGSGWGFLHGRTV